jgi:DsbC/DsbD-like thiol-disulfide interchange protein
MMPKETYTLNRRKALFALCGAVLAPELTGLTALPASAQGSKTAIAVNQWPEGVFAQLELLEGRSSSDAKGHHNMGISIAMRPGFKTYWRMPGDTGVPPQFNFEGSKNLKDARVFYPAPLRFEDGAGGSSIGYTAPGVIFPVHVEAIDPMRPVNLHVKADYAVCERICIPVSGEATLLLPPGARTDSPHIRAAEARVPTASALRDNGALSIRAISKGQAPESLLIDVTLPDGEPADLFVEAPSPWFFETKSFKKNDGGGRFEIVAIERSKALDCTGVEVVLTVTSGLRAIEVKTWLDVALLTP